jgi:D-alanyl-D-alanine carboxypeptidase (penicillin-binding protein 5/6)
VAPTPRAWRVRAGIACLLLIPLLAGGPALALPVLAASSRRPSALVDRRFHALPGRQPSGAPVRITAIAAVLMDARSGEILYSRNPHLTWPPASTTKILTALVALQSAPLDTLITISPDVARFRVGSVVGLPEGARISLHDLLYGLMLQSGNDVALAIAEGVSGSVPAFVARMNDEARRLGATQTHFTSPHGLYDRDHYTTAYDLALITRAAMQNPTFRAIVRTKRWVFSPPDGPSRTLWNHNRLLWWYPGADGVKTGYVHQSGETLVASATRDGWRLIAVLLRSNDLWGDAYRLLTSGFTHYHPEQLARAGEELAAIEVRGTDRVVLGVAPGNVYAALAPGEVPRRHVVVRPHLALPIRRGEPIGTVEFYAGARLLRTAPVVAAGDVRVPTGIQRMVRWVGKMVTRISGAAVL